MATRHDLVDWVYRAIHDNGGKATLAEVAKHIWKHHEAELRSSGDLFFTWQYDMRWAATRLRRTEKLKAADLSRRGDWELS